MVSPAPSLFGDPDKGAFSSSWRWAATDKPHPSTHGHLHGAPGYVNRFSVTHKPKKSTQKLGTSLPQCQWKWHQMWTTAEECRKRRETQGRAGPVWTFQLPAHGVRKGRQNKHSNRPGADAGRCPTHGVGAWRPGGHSCLDGHVPGMGTGMGWVRSPGSELHRGG